jgi:hypothetical protein
MLATINRQAFRAYEMIADMMLFARPSPPEPQPVDVEELIDRTVRELAADAAAQATSLSHVRRVDSADHPAVGDSALGDRLFVLADPVQLAVVLRALCANALEALGAGGRVEVAARRCAVGCVKHTPNAHAPSDRHALDSTIAARADTPNAGRPASRGDDPAGHAASGAVAHDAVEITVADNGPGMSERERTHLFDPFFSGREAGRGLGFGLSKCWRIITAHRGHIDVDSQPGRGAKMIVTLPGKCEA